MLRRESGDDLYIETKQPRKVTVITDERGCLPPSAVGGSVGYAIQLDRPVDLGSCRIVYMTIGILLRMLVNGKGRAAEDESREDTADADSVMPPLLMETISHLIIDETHGRYVTCNFSLTLLKGILSSSSSKLMPRLILISATASSKVFLS